jgi:hypothetical protein
MTEAGATVYGTVRSIESGHRTYSRMGAGVRCTVLYGWRTVEGNRTGHAPGPVPPGVPVYGAVLRSGG